MGERNMVIGNVVEEVNLVFLEEQPRSDRVYRSITPSLIEEAAILVELVEVIRVGLGSKPIEIPNFEVGPLGRKIESAKFPLTRLGHVQLTKWQ